MADLVADAKTAYLGAVAAADPTRLVKAHVRTGAIDDWLKDRERPEMIHVLALGKAAPRMLWGLVEANVPFRGIGVTTDGQTKPLVDTFSWHVGGHPIPDGRSFAAGDAVLRWIDALPAGAPVLVLMSGGASACIEAADDPDAVIEAHRRWAAEGLDTVALNQCRAEVSKIKGGRLARALARGDHALRVWTLCDLPPEHMRSVGSGPFDVPEVEHTMLADSSLLAQGAAQTLAGLGYEVFGTDHRLHGDMAAEVDAFLDTGVGPGQALVGHGEPTLRVPADAPPGGRCPHAALLAAPHLADGDVFFAGASDGIDGSSGEAAAWSHAADGEQATALARFEAHRYLAACGQTLRMGATGSNLNDLWIWLRAA